MVKEREHKLHTLETAFPYSIHGLFFKRATPRGAPSEEELGIQAGYGKRFWRSVFVEQIDDGVAKDLGYWVRQGIDDTSL